MITKVKNLPKLLTKLSTIAQEYTPIWKKSQFAHLHQAAHTQSAHDL